MEGVTGGYVNAKAERTPWRASVLDERDAVWDLCGRLSGLAP